MTDAERKRAMDILGGAAVLDKGASREKAVKTRTRTRGRELTVHELTVRKKWGKVRTFLAAADERTGWTELIRAGIPSEALAHTAERLLISVAQLSESLGLPSRTVHRRLENGELLTAEETERSLRAARVLARAQELLGEEEGRAWVLEANRALGAVVPLTLLDTADGFQAVLDELGRLEYGVIS